MVRELRFELRQGLSRKLSDTIRAVSGDEESFRGRGKYREWEAAVKHT